MRRVLLMVGVLALSLSGSVAMAGHHHGHGGYGAGYRGGYGPSCNHGAYGSYYRGYYGAPAYGAYYRAPVYVAPAPPVYYGPQSGLSLYTPGFSFSFGR